MEHDAGFPVKILRRVLVKAAAFMMSACTPAPAQTRPGGDGLKIIVLLYEEQLGSLMTGVAVLSALRTACPDARVTVLGDALAGEALQGSPLVDEVIVTAHPSAAPWRFRRDWRRLRLARREKWDRLFSTLGARRLGVGAAALAVPATRRAGYAAPAVLPDYDFPLLIDPGLSQIDNNLRILQALGVAPPRRRPVFPVSAAAAAQAAGLLAAVGIGAERAFAVFIVETSGGQPTDWEPERLAQVADDLATRRGLLALFVGTARGAAIIEAVRDRMTVPSVSLAGRTGVPQLAGVLARAAAAVSLDTGAMHVAVAVGVPLVVVASSWQPAHLWLPLGFDDCIVLSRPDVPCAGCGLSACADRRCMDIAAADVVAACERLLDRRLQEDG